MIATYNLENKIIEEMEIKELRQFGNTKGIKEVTWPKKILEWVTPERRKKGRLRRDQSDKA